jgi:parallel beta-helix repeat protein
MKIKMKIMLLSALTAISIFPVLAGPAPDTKPLGQVLDAKSYVNRDLPDCGLQAAIDKVAADGGGTVRIPEGEYPLRCGLVLKSNVILEGAGQGKTVLLPWRKEERVEITALGPDAEGWVAVDKIPDTMKAGSAITIWRAFPMAHQGYQSPAWGESVDREGRKIKLKAPLGWQSELPGKMQPGKNIISFGTALALDKPVAKGDIELVFKDASILKAGDELAVGEPGNDSRDRMRFVKEVKGNTVVLTEAIKEPLESWTGKQWNSVINMPYALFPAIHGWDVKNAGIRNLAVRGHGNDRIYPGMTRYTLSAIHIFNSDGVSLDGVEVRDWPADGISLQTGKNVQVLNCQATRILGNGFHPGTNFTDGVFDRCIGDSCGSGFYWCWSNSKNTVKNCRFVNSRGGGMTGLGNPRDKENLIENNEISDNGEAGIEINGGLESGNIIRGNTIANNSQKIPGKFPGIAVYASTEDAKMYTIEGNTVRDTQSTPTQWVGIEEKNSVYQKKPTAADKNIFRKNVYSGHKTADIIKAGAETVIEEKDGVKIIPAAPPEKGN